jgi:hypothetical protein
MRGPGRPEGGREGAAELAGTRPSLALRLAGQGAVVVGEGPKVQDLQPPRTASTSQAARPGPARL